MEIAMAIWILTNYKSKSNAVIQISIIILMNVLELIFTPDLLLFGRFNFALALLFSGLIYYNEFAINKRLNLYKTK